MQKIDDPQRHEFAADDDPKQCFFCGKSPVEHSRLNNGGLLREEYRHLAGSQLSPLNQPPRVNPLRLTPDR